MDRINGKTINGLMRHLRDTHNVHVSGSKDKLNLINMGYYHGYKGYRFIKHSHQPIPYSTFEEITNVYEFDRNLNLNFTFRTAHAIIIELIAVQCFGLYLRGFRCV